MRLMAWNCRVGAFKRKAARTAPFNPDVLVVPEVERLDGELFLDGERQPSFMDRVAKSDWPRGIGVFSYTGTELARAFDDLGLVSGFAPFNAKRGATAFNVVAVWTFKTDVAATSYRQAHEGIQRWSDWIRQAPTVILGDFNIAANFEGGKAWRDLLNLMTPLGLVSAYHSFHRESPGEESRPTYFHRGSDSSTWHIDYCFVPSAWASRITDVHVGRHEQWRDVSDHVPLIVDLDLD